MRSYLLSEHIKPLLATSDEDIHEVWLAECLEGNEEDFSF
jgi:hypothetical protein